MKQIWQKPQLQSHQQGQHRKVSWLELFFDLVFVVVIAQLAHHFAAHPSAATFGQLVFCLLPVWLIWNGTTYYNERFETQGLENRLQFLALIATVTLLACFTQDPLGSQWLGFAGAYILARGINIGLWLWAGLHHRAFMKSSLRFAFGYIIGVVCILMAWIRPTEERLFWWSLGLAAEFAGPLLSIWHSRSLPDFSSSKLPERMGLFVIIVLGEAIAGLVRGLQSRLSFNDLGLIGTAFVGLLFGFLIWWLYFECVGIWTERKSNLWTWAWSYLHAPLVLVVAALGSLLDPVLRQDPHAGPWLLGGTALLLTIIGLMEYTLQKPKASSQLSNPRTKIICAPILGILASLNLEIWTSLYISTAVLAAFAWPMRSWESSFATEHSS